MRCILFVVFFALCGCNSKGSEKLDTRPKIGVDPTWSPLVFGPQNSHVNGFTNELLLEIAANLGIEFNKIRSNPGDLLPGLDEGIYDGVLTSVPPYTYNLAKYDFSKTFLETGPVFVVPIKASYKKLSQIQHQSVGVIAGSRSVDLFARYPTLLVRKYLSIPDLLNGIVEGEIAGGLLPKILAVAYVPDLYQETLKVASSPLNPEGLHLVVLKNTHEDLIQGFDEALKQLKRKKKLEDLTKKWSLSQ